MSTINDLRKNMGLKALVETPTGSAMTNPSPVSAEIAQKVLQDFDLLAVLRDMGTVAAREFSNELETMALRPADFASLPHVSEIAAIRLASLLVQLPQVFSDSFLQALRSRG